MMSHDIFFFHFYFSFEQVETETSSLFPARWWVMPSSSFIFISALNRLIQKRRLWFLLNDESCHLLLSFFSALNRLKQKRRLWFLLNDESCHLLLSFLFKFLTGWNRNGVFGPYSMISHAIFFFHFYFSFEQVETETSSLVPAQWWVMTYSSFIFISALNKLKQRRSVWFMLNDESCHVLISFLFQLLTGWNRNVVFGSCSMMSHAIFFFHFYFSMEQVWNRNVVFGSCSMMSHAIFFFHFYFSF